MIENEIKTDKSDIKSDKEALSIAEFEDLYSICRSTIMNEIKKGRLKARKVGTRRILIRIEDAKEWAKSLDDANP